MTINTLGDLMQVLSVYDEKLPVRFFSNGVGGRWPLSPGPMTCDVDEAIGAVENLMEIGKSDYLRIALFPSEADQAALEHAAMVAHETEARGGFVFEPAHAQTVRQALRVHGGNPPGLKQAAEYIERMEQRIRQLESGK